MVRAYKRYGRKKYISRVGSAALSKLARKAKTRSRRMSRNLASQLAVPVARAMARSGEHKSYDGATAAVISMGVGVDLLPAAGPSNTQFQPSATTMAGCINQIAQGTGNIQRIGKKVMMRALHLRGHMYLDPALDASVSGGAVSMVLVYDRDPNKSASVPPATTVFAAQSSLAQTNKDFATRFKILRRWDWSLSGSSVDATGDPATLTIQQGQRFDEYYTFPESAQEVLWDTSDVTGNFTSIVKGALYLYGLSNFEANCAIVSMSFRIYFDDN